MIGRIIKVKNRSFSVEKLLGKGKSGYSYLISDGYEKLVYKQIHHEPCSYYNFGNKLMAEIHSYKKLKDAGVNLPELIEYNETDEYLIKEFIDGQTAAEMCAEGTLDDSHFESMFGFTRELYRHKLNVDFFPTNFVFLNRDVYLIDYECNEYNSEWDFENWGIYFWLNTGGMKEHLEKGHSTKLCYPDSSKPIREFYIERAEMLIKKFRE